MREEYDVMIDLVWIVISFGLVLIIYNQRFIAQALTEGE